MEDDSSYLSFPLLPVTGIKANACIFIVLVVPCVVSTVRIACALFINCMHNAAKLHTFAFVFYGRQIIGTVLGKGSRRHTSEKLQKRLKEITQVGTCPRFAQ